MRLIMSGTDYSLSEIETREKLSFDEGEAARIMRLIASREGIGGCVLLSTCNRTEIYITCEEDTHRSPLSLLCAAAGKNAEDFAPSFISRSGRGAAEHLMAVACGLRSQIWGEDQILAQVKSALDLAHREKTADPVLSSLFRSAVTAGKEVRTALHFTPLASSAAFRCVQVLQERLGPLSGKRALVIGNGEMGRLAASLLCDAGCHVTMTVRTYRHGEAAVPDGCASVPYDKRAGFMQSADILLSATKSPHYTVHARQLRGLESPPFVCDLAIPRDIDPEVAEIPGIEYLNVDMLGTSSGDSETLTAAKKIIDSSLGDFFEWWSYRECLPVISALKSAIAARIPDCDTVSVGKTVDLLTQGLKGCYDAESLGACLDKIASCVHSRRAPQIEPGEKLRFPLFVDLHGRQAVIIGGGAVALRRADVLASFGCDVKLIAPTVARGGSFSHEKRVYSPGDLAGACLAVAATDSRETNHAVYEEAMERGIPVSVADCQRECTFFFPAVCVGGGMSAGVVSDGSDHKRTAKAAKAIRKILDEA